MTRKMKVNKQGIHTKLHYYTNEQGTVMVSPEWVADRLNRPYNEIHRLVQRFSIPYEKNGRAYYFDLAFLNEMYKTMDKQDEIVSREVFKALGVLQKSLNSSKVK